MAKRVGIIGAGVAGLAAIKSSVEEGMTPVCWEQAEDIGGLWKYSDKPRHGFPSLYNSCIINTCKEMTCYSDFPIPKEFPNFMSHRYFKKYLDMYAQAYSLRQYISFNKCVDNVEKACDFDSSGQWIVTSRDLGTGTVRKETVEALIVCNGHLHEPNMPNIDGLESFKGKVLHTRDFKDFRGYEGQRILIVGIGNSGSDVACELSRHAQHVFMSTRRGAYVIQRAGDFGQPFDQACIKRWLQILPHSLMRPLHYHKINYKYKHSLYSLSPNFRFDSGVATISDDLPNRILIGAITIHEDVAYFTETSAVLQDGKTLENLDVVIFATGFNFSFPFMEDKSIIKIDGHYPWLYNLIFPPSLQHSTLAVIGLVQPFGSLPPILEMQARVAARVMSGKIQLPDKEAMKNAILQRKNFLHSKYVDSPRYSIQVYFIDYLDTLAEMIGCKPNIRKYFLTNPKLWYKVVFGPATPPQWRLEGPGQWESAVEAIMKVDERTYYPMKTRVAGLGEKNGLYDGWIKLFKYLIFIVLSTVVLTQLRAAV